MDNETMIVISDSSPLISLAVIKQLNVLGNLFKEIYVPTAVYEEVV
jgi:predicted nucleic acid-binding protein